MINSQQSQKRPMNAFLIFCKRHRSVVREKYPLLENRSITKILGEWWAALDGDEKQNYTDLAKQYKEAFMKANPHFKWYKTADLRPPPQPQPQPQQQQQMSVVVSKAPITASTTIAMPILINANNGVIVQQAANNLPPTTTGNNNTETDNSVVANVGETSATVATSAASTSSATGNSNSSTPKPPKKRYLESMEAGGDYVKSKFSSPHGHLSNLISVWVYHHHFSHLQCCQLATIIEQFEQYRRRRGTEDEQWNVAAGR